jgi:outer membrane protein assembly factor BamD
VVYIKRTLLILALCAMPVAAGCAARKVPTGEDYYARAQSEYVNHYYRPAIDDYQHLIDQFPFSANAQDAELKIGLSHYQLHQYAEAIGTLSDFIQMHPTSKELDLASYYLGMSYFEQIGRPDQDQSSTEAALKQFQIVERRFPESNFAALAQQQITICRAMLADHEYLIGDFYYKRANFRATESRMAELVAKYPDTPIAPEALYQLAVTLQKQGKEYSAAQAFTGLKLHFPNTPFAKEAQQELAKLKQPVDTEEDPLRLVLTESGYSQDQTDRGGVIVRQRMPGGAQMAGAADGSGIYGKDDLPDLGRAAAADTVGGSKEARRSGPVTLRDIRLASSDPPLSVILDLTGPVRYKQHLQNVSDYSALTVKLKNTTPDKKLERHMVFDRSIFKDCDVTTDSSGTTITMYTTPVSNFAIVPLEQPARLLVTFTPQSPVVGQAAANPPF